MNKKITAGFTMVELLIVLGIFVIIFTLLANLFFSFLRATVKSKTVQEVKQNGNYSLAIMQRMIRDAKGIAGPCESGMTSLIITNQDNGRTTFDCLDIGLETGRIASNSASLTNDRVRLDQCIIDCQASGGDALTRVSIDFTFSHVWQSDRLEDKYTFRFRGVTGLRNH